MSWNESASVTAKIRPMRFVLYAIWAFASMLFFTGTAKAEPSWCVRELARSDESAIVAHNPECDLRILPRLYPQKDDDGKVLPEQVQLRSIYAANQTQTIDGKIHRYTVMRGCVSPGKPSPYADEEELKLCPKGLMNYFSAPASDSAARIVIPSKRQLTLVEHYTKLSEKTCSRLQSKLGSTNEDRKLASDCTKSFAKLSFTASAASPSALTVVPDETDKKLVKELENEKAALIAKLAVLEKADDKSQFIFPLFILLVGLALVGAASTVLAIKTNRDKKHLQIANTVLVSERSMKRQAILKEFKSQVEKEFQDAWNTLLSKQQNEIAYLKQANEELIKRMEDFRVSIVECIDEAGTSQIRDPKTNEDPADLIRRLRSHVAEKDQQIADLKSEVTALADSNTRLENASSQYREEARDALREKADLERDAEESNSRAAVLFEECAFLQTSIQEKNTELVALRDQLAECETSANTLKDEKSVLEARLERLLAAAGLCGTSIGIHAIESKRSALPFGNKTDELADCAKDTNEKVMAADAAGFVPDEKSEAGDRGNPDRWEGMIVTEGLQRIPIDLDPDELPPYRDEMPTLEREVPVSKIMEEQMIHYRNAWMDLARNCALILDADLQVGEHSNVLAVNATLADKLEGFRDDCLSAKIELTAQKHKFSSTAVRITELEARLNAKTSEHEGAMRVVNVLRQSIDQLALDVKGDKALEKLYAYQLAKIQAEERAIHAEIALRDASLELRKVKMQFQDQTYLSELLQLNQKNWNPAHAKLAELSNDQLLCLAGALFHAIADRVKSGLRLEYPLSSDADLGAIRSVMMMPLVGDYPYVMPEILKNMAGQGPSKLYHTVHDAFADMQPKAVAVCSQTMLPAAGVPEDRNGHPSVIAVGERTATSATAHTSTEAEKNGIRS